MLNCIQSGEMHKIFKMRVVTFFLIIISFWVPANAQHMGDTLPEATYSNFPELSVSYGTQVFTVTIPVSQTPGIFDDNAIELLIPPGCSNSRISIVENGSLVDLSAEQYHTVSVSPSYSTINLEVHVLEHKPNELQIIYTIIDPAIYNVWRIEKLL